MPVTALIRRRAAMAAGVMFVATLLLRGMQLGRPSTYVFDENFYVNDALDLVTHGAERTFVGHPPLGKWLIGLPFFLGRFSPVTWRLSALVAGAIVVALTLVASTRLTRSVWTGVAAGAVVVTDGIAHAVGRYGLLDGFVTLFSTAALAVLLLTVRDRMRYPVAILVGALCGAALASKWSAAAVVALAVAVCARRAWSTDGVGRAASIAAAAVGAAVVAYIGSFTPWIVGGGAYGNCVVPACSTNPVARLVRLPSMQVTMLTSDASVGRPQRQSGPAWRWVLQDRSMNVRVAECEAARDSTCRPRSVSRIVVPIEGNRVLWLLSLPVFALWAVRRRRTQLSTAGIGLAIAWAFALWLPWLFVSSTYVVYAAPIVPALAIALVAACCDLVAPGRLRATVLGSAVALSGVFFLLSRTAPPWAR